MYNDILIDIDSNTANIYCTRVYRRTIQFGQLTRVSVIGTQIVYCNIMNRYNSTVKTVAIIYVFITIIHYRTTSQLTLLVNFVILRVRISNTR